jgi:hypothetical protein
MLLIIFPSIYILTHFFIESKNAEEVYGIFTLYNISYRILKRFLIYVHAE